MTTRKWAPSLMSLVAALALASLSAAVPAQQGGSTGATVSVWSGVYTTTQSKRGEKVHASGCAMCHGAELNGVSQPDMPASPGIAGEDLLFKWSGKTVAELFAYVHQKMPTDNPGRLSAQEAIDSIAHMFAVSEMPAGDKELPPDSKVLENVLIERKLK